ncbi:BrnA antitoxin family protein [Crenothrix sp.]|uniref:BrnA antitoxin family protein n=1 Tax=Crenothrix sp. TaxID=3100433 RepID=UPI00374D12CC
MTGSKTNTMSREEVLAAIRNIPESANFVWDGIDEDERPATKEELLAGIVAMEARRGRPSGSDKTQIALRVDNSVLEAFRATGKGWQTRMNDALKEWLKERAA